MTYLGPMVSCDRGIWSDSKPDRALARQMFGLTHEQSQHPHLCFEELDQTYKLRDIVISALVYPRRVLRCYLFDQEVECH